MEAGRLYFRVIQGDGSWMCRRGREEIDRHDSRQEAVDHMSELAAEHRPSEVFLHEGDGTVVSIVTFF